MQNPKKQQITRSLKEHDDKGKGILGKSAGVFFENVCSALMKSMNAVPDALL
jgi:hypothetical protein